MNRALLSGSAVLLYWQPAAGAQSPPPWPHGGSSRHRLFPEELLRPSRLLSRSRSPSPTPSATPNLPQDAESGLSRHRDRTITDVKGPKNPR